jgi:hypothetical protein
MSWSEIGRYNASTPDGDVETVILEKDDQGPCIFRKIQREVNDDLESDLNNVWDNFYEGDSEEPTVHDYNDCDYTD